MPEAEGVLLRLYIKAPFLEGEECFQIVGEIGSALIQFPHQAEGARGTTHWENGLEYVCVKSD